jgi:AraC-like DNA-binding protein
MHTQRGSAIHDRELVSGLASDDRVAALVVTPAVHAHLRDALGAAAELRAQHCVREHLACVESDRVVLSVIEITEATASAHIECVRLLRSGFPSVPVLAYCDPAGGTSGLIVDVVRAGATGLVLRGIDDSRVVLRTAIQRARRSTIAHQIFMEVAPLLTNDARLFLRYAIEHCAADVSVEVAAHDLGVDRKTLTNWLARAGGPRAREFLSWIRLIVAAQMLSDPKRTAEQVALALDFPSGTSFRNMLRRYVNVTTVELHHGGGASLVLDAFKRQLRNPVATIEAPDRVAEASRVERSVSRADDATRFEIPA